MPPKKTRPRLTFRSEAARGELERELRVPQPVEQARRVAEEGRVLFEVDADAAEEDAPAADVRLVRQRRRVERHEHNVVPARQQLRRQRVVAQTTPAVHLRGPGRDVEKAHVSPGGRAVEGSARVEVLEEVALVRLIPADDAGRHRPDVETADEGRPREAADEPFVLRDGRDDEARAERLGYLVLPQLDDAREG